MRILFIIDGLPGGGAEKVVLTLAGATYFNSHEAADLRAIAVTVAATDDVTEG